MIWWLLVGTAVLILLFYARTGANAVWGTATLGAVVGVVLAIIYPGDFWWIVAKAISVGALVGFIFEMLPKLIGRSSK